VKFMEIVLSKKCVTICMRGGTDRAYLIHGIPAQICYKFTLLGIARWNNHSRTIHKRAKHVDLLRYRGGYHTGILVVA
jgi:hypothetical protein